VQRGNTSRASLLPAATILFTAGGALYGESLSEMESAMRRIMAAGLMAVGGMLAGAPVQADWVPAFKGNDTGGIIAYALGQQTDARQLAVDHCAAYGKVVKFLGVQPQYGGYISFACRWVPYGATEMPLRTLY
jgi:hypothetical protein